LCLTKHHAVKTYLVSGCIVPHILDLGAEWSPSRPDPFSPMVTSPRTHWIGGFVGPKDGLDAVAKRINPCPCRELKESRDSSVGIALGYGLDDRGSRVRFSAGAGNFSPHHRVQNCSGAHRASYPMRARDSFLGGKAAVAWSLPLTSI
jgi:hypothetical protein